MLYQKLKILNKPYSNILANLPQHSWTMVSHALHEKTPFVYGLVFKVIFFNNIFPSLLTANNKTYCNQKHKSKGGKKLKQECK